MAETVGLVGDNFIRNDAQTGGNLQSNLALRQTVLTDHCNDGPWPIFKATNPTYPSYCAYCKSNNTSGCWRRGWSVHGNNQHVNLCNKCGLRYKHGRLPNVPAPPPHLQLPQHSASAEKHRTVPQTSSPFMDRQEVVKVHPQTSAMPREPPNGPSTSSFHQGLVPSLAHSIGAQITGQQPAQHSIGAQITGQPIQHSIGAQITGQPAQHSIGAQITGQQPAQHSVFQHQQLMMQMYLMHHMQQQQQQQQQHMLAMRTDLGPISSWYPQNNNALPVNSNAPSRSLLHNPSPELVRSQSYPHPRGHGIIQASAHHTLNEHGSLDKKVNSGSAVHAIKLSETGSGSRLSSSPGVTPQQAGGAGSSGAKGSTDHYWEPRGSSSCDSINERRGVLLPAATAAAAAAGRTEAGDPPVPHVRGGEDLGRPPANNHGLLEPSGAESGGQPQDELLADLHGNGHGQREGGGSGGSGSDEELQALMSKRPCSRNRRDAALTLMEINWATARPEKRLGARSLNNRGRLNGVSLHQSPVRCESHSEPNPKPREDHFIEQHSSHERTRENVACPGACLGSPVEFPMELQAPDSQATSSDYTTARPSQSQLPLASQTLTAENNEGQMYCHVQAPCSINSFDSAQPPPQSIPHSYLSSHPAAPRHAQQPAAVFQSAPHKTPPFNPHHQLPFSAGGVIAPPPMPFPPPGLEPPFFFFPQQSLHLAIHNPSHMFMPNHLGLYQACLAAVSSRPTPQKDQKLNPLSCDEKAALEDNGAPPEEQVPEHNNVETNDHSKPPPDQHQDQGLEEGSDLKTAVHTEQKQDIREHALVSTKGNILQQETEQVEAGKIGNTAASSGQLSEADVEDGELNSILRNPVKTQEDEEGQQDSHTAACMGLPTTSPLGTTTEPSPCTAAGTPPVIVDINTAVSWSVKDVQEWLSRIGAEDLADPFQAQSIDGQALQLLYRMGAAPNKLPTSSASSLQTAEGLIRKETLHALIREEFGSGARLGHRLRLLEGMEKLFGTGAMMIAAATST
ncbi:hypothetical protein CEUSTIGMA_g6786.t1 [Chlamydomonas eustigma]|uniref:SAM domain-containing protein n=1 Tax=Chlamydomonas eustigma TaxID=1157962 RepID=A0A250X8D8_9CHLO|nr:hypothetical protein CEUSTIGMA_g6786.t1 [Chlamydomonas eustigma]|eukprot:GAX79344.1 hypothetical protein CEUSTIGMA_g6786.t1 [Chlamydomonas eustigma]